MALIGTLLRWARWWRRPPTGHSDYWYAERRFNMMRAAERARPGE